MRLMTVSNWLRLACYEDARVRAQFLMVLKMVGMPLPVPGEMRTAFRRSLGQPND